MAPKARPIDLQLVQTLLDQGHTQRQIAEQLQLPESTLRHRLKQVGISRVHQGPPEGGIPEGHLRTPQNYTGVPQVYTGTPEVGTPYGHLGIPGAGTPKVHQGTPHDSDGIPQVSLGTPEKGIPEEHQGTPLTEIAARWPEVRAMLAWWQSRQHAGRGETPRTATLVRHTFHVEEALLEAMRREAALARTSIAEVVNRAFRAYLTHRDTEGTP
jgi:hypothetical protein